jgi:hypothetical protein
LSASAAPLAFRFSAAAELPKLRAASWLPPDEPVHRLRKPQAGSFDSPTAGRCCLTATARTARAAACPRHNTLCSMLLGKILSY